MSFKGTVVRGNNSLFNRAYLLKANSQSGPLTGKCKGTVNATSDYSGTIEFGVGKCKDEQF